MQFLYLQTFYHATIRFLGNHLLRYGDFQVGSSRCPINVAIYGAGSSGTKLVRLSGLTELIGSTPEGDIRKYLIILSLPATGVTWKISIESAGLCLRFQA